MCRRVALSPQMACHSRKHAADFSGLSSTNRNSSKNALFTSCNSSKRVVALPTSMTRGSDWSVPRTCQPKSGSVSRHRSCMFSTKSTRRRSSSLAPSSTTPSASCASSGRHRRSRSSRESRSVAATSGRAALISRSSWNRTSSQNSPKSKTSGFSSISRTGWRRSDSPRSRRISAAALARSMVFPLPRGPTTRRFWQQGASTFCRRVSSTPSSSASRTTN